ncbi:hypothetical protein MHH85_11010 [Viridibacillus sp. FSL E2-0187]|uniref:hypothetical protein n=1 Tax=Viridibacillus sp. FSL E2-0187 TaxID=2921362 RepID=UPI0030F8EBB6
MDYLRWLLQIDWESLLGSAFGAFISVIGAIYIFKKESKTTLDNEIIVANSAVDNLLAEEIRLNYNKFFKNNEALLRNLKKVADGKSGVNYSFNTYKDAKYISNDFEDLKVLVIKAEPELASNVFAFYGMLKRFSDEKIENENNFNSLNSYQAETYYYAIKFFEERYF